MFINHYTSCLLLHLFHVLMSIKKVQISSQQLLNRESPWAFTRKLFILCQGVKLPSEILQNTFYFSRRRRLSISVEHLSVFLQNISQYFCGPQIGIFAEPIFTIFEENFSSVLQKTFQLVSEYLLVFCRVYLSSFTEHFAVFFGGSSVCIARSSIFIRTAFSNFAEHLSIFAEYLHVLLQ